MKAESARAGDVGSRPAPGASTFIVKWIALSSYSLYLTHTLMIHVARKVVAALPILPWPAYFPIAAALVFGAGGLFYFSLERTSIVCRDRWVPRRKSISITHKG